MRNLGTFLAVAVCLLGHCLARELVQFDYGWRFQKYDPPGQQPVCQYEEDLTGKQCQGLHYTPQGRTNVTDCKLACCSRSDCYAWTMVKEGWPWSCYISIGTNFTCSGTSSGTVAGGRRTSIPAYPPDFTYAKPGFGDGLWEVVDAPHDFVVNGTYDQNEDNLHGSLPRYTGWYRKHFHLPQKWQGAVIGLKFEAVFHVASIWVNGEYLGTFDGGYTPIIVQLDQLQSLRYGPQSDNVVAVRADARFGSGHWYEGGGLYRSVWLLSKDRMHIPEDGVFASESNSTGDNLTPSVEIHNLYTTGGAKTVFARWTVIDEGGVAVGSGASAPRAAPASGQTEIHSAQFAVAAQLWTVQKPILYTLVTEIVDPGDNRVIDSVNTTVGFRNFAWTADKGFFLNGQHVHLRGFCHHEDFAGVGVAVPDRVNLFRAQALRSVGGNSWRTSHNPYRTSVYDILDRVGVLVWDEARDYDAWNVADMAAMVRRDRNHPSVVIWSYCNEIECHQDASDNTTQFQFRAAAKDTDPTRPTSYNWVAPASAVVDLAIDVHGISHYNSETYDGYHQQNPKTPMVSSECCSCETQRGENVIADKNTVFWTSFSGQCLAREVPWTETLGYIGGTLGVWTLFDYYGEPSRWPHVSSSFGQFDLAGFTKPHALWYQSVWLCNISSSDAGRPPFPQCTTVKLAQSWNAPASPTIDVFTSAPVAELLVNGKSLGDRSVGAFGYAEWTNVTFEPGTIVARAKDAQGRVLATDASNTVGAAAALFAWLDAPSTATGTGSHLVLDGHDAALVGVAVVDSAKQTVPSANHTVTFRVVSGPGRIIGVGNGDPSSHEPNQVPHRSAYHGLVRAVVQVSVDCVTFGHDGLIQSIDAEGGKRTPVHSSCPADTHIVVEASAPGLTSVSVSIPVSADVARHGYLTAAATSVQPSVLEFK